MHSKLIRVRLTPLEQRLYYSLLRDDRRTVDLPQAIRRLGVKPPHARKILHTMNAKGVLRRATRGHYLVASPQSLAAATPAPPDPLAALDDLCKSLHVPYYAAYRTAAYLHGLADQVPFAVHVAVPRWRRPILIGPVRISFHQVPHPETWATVRRPYAEAHVTVSDPWRTLLDCASRLDLVGGVDELVNFARESVRPPTGSRPQRDAMGWPYPPASHAQHFADRGAMQRLGYAYKLLGVPEGSPAARFQRQLARHRGPRVVLFDPAGPPRGRVDYEWGVQDNVPRRRLQVA